MQPPTRDDWITGIREAVDACSPGKNMFKIDAAKVWNKATEKIRTAKTLQNTTDLEMQKWWIIIKMFEVVVFK